MKKTAFLVIVCALLLLLYGCGQNDYTLELIIPAGDGTDFYYSDQQLSPQGIRTTISAGAGIAHAQVMLIDEYGLEYGPFPLGQEALVRPNLDQGAWYRIGVAMAHDGSGPAAVELRLDGVQLRIE